MRHSEVIGDFMKNFSKAILFLAVILISFSLGACNNKTSVQDIIKVCEERYSDKFSLVSTGSELWNANYSDVVLSSETLGGAKVNVRVYPDGKILDNYIAVKYKSLTEKNISAIAEKIYGEVLVVNVPVSFGVESFESTMTFEDYVRSYESKVFVGIATNDSIALKDEKIEKLRIAFEKEEICTSVKILYYDVENIRDIKLSEGTGKIFEQTPIARGFMRMNPDFSVSSLSWGDYNE